MNSNLASPLLDRIERANLFLGVAAIAVSGLLWQGPGMVAACAGAGLGALNFRLLRRIGVRTLTRFLGAGPDGPTPGAAGKLVGALLFKMLGLFGMVYLAVGPLGLLPIPFTLGISGFVVSIAAVSLLAPLDSPPST